MFRKLFAKTEEKSAQAQVEEDVSYNQPHETHVAFQEKPKICLFDIDKKTQNVLKRAGFNCTVSSLGSVINVPNHKSNDLHFCLLNHSIPSNLHEYNLLIIDLAEKEHVPFDQNAHKRSESESTTQRYLICRYPQTVFDPRPLASRILSSEIEEFQKKESLILVFASSEFSSVYQPVELTSHGDLERDSFTVKNYAFLANVPYIRNKQGTETQVTYKTGELGNILAKYNSRFTYEIIFNHPTHWSSEEKVTIKDTNFIPLISNLNDEIVSYADVFNQSIVFMFPQLNDKSEFLLELFQAYLPELMPNLFPSSTKFAWLENQEYQLPNEAKLIASKNSLRHEYEKQLENTQRQIEENRKKYQFLHDLISKSGDQLVKACEYYLTWLGFDNVIDCDVTYSGLNEEDIQVVLDQGLLVIEVKGIGGTSKDKECSQISKIKYRRAKERGQFDVFALYIVNHQRYLPPEKRKNPPFTQQQIEDAKSDERGLLTTYDLFKLYFAIEAGLITKQDARHALLAHGLVEFKPSNAILIGQPTEIHFNGTVCIFILPGISVNLGDELFAQNKTGLYKVKIVSIRDQNLDVESVSEGEIGIKFSDKVTIDSEFWKPTEG
jgi:hypothetical protein